MRKIVDLSRVRAESRKKRAPKAVRILKNEFGEEVSISRELNEHVWRNGIENPPTKLEVEEVEGFLYPVTEEETSERDTVEEVDYSSVVDGNIDEVKQRVSEMENPDVEKLVEAEEEGRDRKTLKEWLNKQ